MSVGVGVGVEYTQNLNMCNIIYPKSSVCVLNDDDMKKYKYSALSIYRANFSTYISRTTPHNSPERTSYGVWFVSANMTEVLLL